MLELVQDRFEPIRFPRMVFQDNLHVLGLSEPSFVLVW